MPYSSWKGWCAALMAGAGMLGLALPVRAQNYTTVEVMSGLFNPRGLTVTADGSIYVAEAGRGGPGTVVTGAAGEAEGYGNTSGVSRLSGGVQERLISTLPSLAVPDGSGATGLHDIIQASNGTFYGVTGFVGSPALRNSINGAGESGQSFGRLVQFDFSGIPTASYVADLSANEVGNPDGTDVNSNPYGLVETPTGFAVADAGANVLLDVTPAGVVSTKTIFPTKPTPPGLPGGPTYQPVTTAVAFGANGQGGTSLFVAELGGFPFPQGGSSIYQVDPTTGSFTELATGFTSLIDLTYRNGSLYALELTTNGLLAADPGPGNLWQVDVVTGQRNLVISGLFLPGGVAVGPGDEIYLTVGSVVPGGGSVVQLVQAAPEPGSVGFLVVGASAVTAVVWRRRRVTG